MWCRSCQQDVPAVAALGDSSRVCCARCGDVLHRREEAERAPTETAPDETAQTLPLDGIAPRRPLEGFHDWQLEEELREAQRLVQKIKTHGGRAHRRDDEDAAARDAQPQRRRSGRRAPLRQKGGMWAWSLAGLGLSGLVCGCALLVWSVASQRQELWTIGLPIALVRQVVLVCGMLLRRDGDEAVTEEERTEPSATYVQVQSSAGGMHPSGLSVHFANAPSERAALDTNRLRRDIETVARRAA